MSVPSLALRPLGHTNLRVHPLCIGAAALQFSLRDPRITSTIVGITRPDRLGTTIAWAQHPIPDAYWEELATITPTSEDPEEYRWSG